MGPGHTIVMVLCDSGASYPPWLFHVEWVASKGLEMPQQNYIFGSFRLSLNCRKACCLAIPWIVP